MVEKLKKLLADEYGIRTEEELLMIMEEGIDISLFAGEKKRGKLVA